MEVSDQVNGTKSNAENFLVKWRIKCCGDSKVNGKETCVLREDRC
jgi:hypothetical protein